MLAETTEIILNWLSGIRIELAVEKTELILPTRMYKHNILQLSVKGQKITSKPCVKYLGVQLDQRMSFKAHAMAVTEKVNRDGRSLRAITPKLRRSETQSAEAACYCPSVIIAVRGSDLEP